MLTEKLRKLTPYLMAGAIALGGCVYKGGLGGDVSPQTKSDAWILKLDSKGNLNCQ
jgi:hypothetical protein